MEKKLLPPRSCPYCDSERGLFLPWGMSPEGWARMKEAHDAGHPSAVEKALEEVDRQVGRAVKRLGEV